jgi:T5SS/PEP-CTERM-associated repeat protein/autotransporter-associated beta strand protein
MDGFVFRGNAGTINLNAGGTLHIGNGGTRGWLEVTTFTNDGMLVFNRSDASTYSGYIVGTGSTVKRGASTLTLQDSFGVGTYVVDMGQTLHLQEGSVEIVSGGTGMLFIGSSGTGAVRLDGGRIANAACFLGSGPGTVGSATVTSGTWVNGGTQLVGVNGSGTLVVHGGSVTGNQGDIGVNPGSLGVVAVTGGTWSVAGTLSVGLLGTGSLGVTGGRIESFQGIIGSGTGGVGAATITSGTWATNQDLSVGGDGAGTLTIADGGSVVVGGNCFRGSAGTINLNPGGTLQIGTGGTRGGLDVPTLTNNGTLIFNRSDAATYAGTISGSGTIVKLGAGPLTLAGPNSTSGLTTLAGGTLALSGSGSIGTGGLNLGTAAGPGTFDLAALTAGTYSLPATGDLTGVGTLFGPGKSLAVLGSFLPGNSPGTVTVGTGFTLDLANSGTSLFEITSPIYTAGTFDLVNGAGSVVFGGVLDLAFTNGPYANGTDVLTIFAATGGFSGDFTSVVATGLGAGQSATFNPATGTISVVPEPSTYAISTIATVGLAGLMRRRRRPGPCLS